MRASETARGVLPPSLALTGSRGRGVAAVLFGEVQKTQKAPFAFPPSNVPKQKEGTDDPSPLLSLQLPLLVGVVISRLGDFEFAELQLRSAGRAVRSGTRFCSL